MARLPSFALPDRLTRLNARERRLASILGGFVAFVAFLAFPGYLEARVHSQRSTLDELRAALDDVQGARAVIRDRQARKSSIALRYQKRAPALAGLIEQLASAQKLEVVDSTDRADQPHGKRFSERQTTVHLKKSGMLAIAKFLESIEQSGYPIMVSQIDLRKRAGEPDMYDIEVTISAFDKVEAPPAAPAASAGTP
jgi:general secretion pathway protein M